MKCTRLTLVVLCVSYFGLLISPPALAVLGDCDGNGGCDADDVIYLVSYFYSNGPAPQDPECDCDGFCGVTYGDLYQIGYFIFCGGSLYPPGLDYYSPATNTTFRWKSKPHSGAPCPGGATCFKWTIYVASATNIEVICLPFTYAANFVYLGDSTELAGGQLHIVNGPPGDYTFFLENSSFSCIYPPYAINQTFVPPAPAWFDPVYTVYFQVLPKGSDAKDTSAFYGDVAPLSTDEIPPVLLAKAFYEGKGGERHLFPQYVPENYDLAGDCNCSGTVDIDDVVCLVGYIFSAGPEPGDCW